MGMEASCDVEGCGSRELFAGDDFAGPFRVPANWCVVLVPPSEIEVSRRKKEMEDMELSSLALPIRGSIPFPEKFIICDKHELPKFKRKV